MKFKYITQYLMDTHEYIVDNQLRSIYLTSIISTHMCFMIVRNIVPFRDQDLDLIGLYLQSTIISKI